MMDQCLQDPKHFTSQLDMLPDNVGSMVSISLFRGASYFSTATDSLSSTCDSIWNNRRISELILQLVTHSLRLLRLLELVAIINALPNRGSL
jgi:hypothetical protein